jgi:Cu(I)/Ag(I) efflux system membrane fusion protein
LRVNVDNPDGKLKPEMFVRAVLRTNSVQGGRVMTPEMAGKWTCPMHPSVVKEQVGSCDICGMDLVTTESLYIKADVPKQAPLVIPASAALITGMRAVVYVRIPQAEKPTYEGREVILGPRAGDYYLVKEGLAEGEIVVTKGNFKIDSALQIQAKPSMMSSGEGVAPSRQHGAKATTGVSTDVVAQTTCPVMGGAVNRDIFTIYEGKKVYFCCPGCKPEFEKNPEKYLAKLPQFKKWKEGMKR